MRHNADSVATGSIDVGVLVVVVEVGSGDVTIVCCGDVTVSGSGDVTVVVVSIDVVKSINPTVVNVCFIVVGFTVVVCARDMSTPAQQMLAFKRSLCLQAYGLGHTLGMDMLHVTISRLPTISGVWA